MRWATDEIKCWQQQPNKNWYTTPLLHHYPPSRWCVYVIVNALLVLVFAICVYLYWCVSHVPLNTLRNRQLTSQVAEIGEHVQLSNAYATASNPHAMQRWLNGIVANQSQQLAAKKWAMQHTRRQMRCRSLWRSILWRCKWRRSPRSVKLDHCKVGEAWPKAGEAWPLQEER